ncbi:MAG: hypothetical protein EZS28_023007 [Streblomastix strix]|uniref:Protein kinase domain-containing protein n=1 Tax=Streblomastix strix TaxID=222440 RepID=A0A5J4VGB5_9EUKA|nr:MAG: hypothetical protein EZS28_023007 [Streblomastix strix]
MDFRVLCTQGFQNIQYLSSGSFGRVYYARNKVGQEVAVKIIPQKHFSSGEHDAATVLDHYGCDYIIKFVDICQVDRDVIIQMEYANYKVQNYLLL